MINAVGTYVVLKEIIEEKEETTKSGLYIASAEIDRSVPRGIVMSTGHEVPENIKEGDTVLFAPHSGVEITENDEDYLVVVWNAIYGKVGGNG